MKLIHVSASICQEPIFGTANQAVANASVINEERRKYVQSGNLIGSTVTSFRHGEDFLEVTTNSGRVMFRIVDLALTVVIDHSSTSPAETISKSEEVWLKFTKGEPFRWDTEKLANERIGKKFQKIFFGTNCMYVYIESTPTLLLSIVNKGPSDNDPNPLLYWDETD